MRRVSDGREFYGIVVEFETPEEIVAAARRARNAGYSKLTAYTPYNVEGLAELVGFRFNWLPILVLLAGFSGAGLGFFMQWYANVYSYPIIVAGRPYNSWPSFIPITFELGVLAASLTAIFGLLALCGLPRLYHPIFSAPYIGEVTEGRFFLCIEADDPVYDERVTRHLIRSLNPREVHDVWH